MFMRMNGFRYFWVWTWSITFERYSEIRILLFIYLFSNLLILFVVFRKRTVLKDLFFFLWSTLLWWYLNISRTTFCSRTKTFNSFAWINFLTGFFFTWIHIKMGLFRLWRRPLRAIWEILLFWLRLKLSEMCRWSTRLSFTCMTLISTLISALNFASTCFSIRLFFEIIAVVNRILFFLFRIWVKGRFIWAITEIDIWCFCWRHWSIVGSDFIFIHDKFGSIIFWLPSIVVNFRRRDLRLLFFKLRGLWIRYFGTWYFLGVVNWRFVVDWRILF